MDVAGGAAAAAAEGGGGGSGGGFVHAVVGYSSSPLIFWFLTVALVAVIHLASGLVSPSPASSRSDGREEEKRTRGGGLAGEERGEAAADGRDDRIMEMMRSFSFMHADDGGFMEGRATYEYVVDDRAPAPATLAESPPPELSSFSFRFQDQIPEICSETAMSSRRISVEEKEEHELEVKGEKESSRPLESAAKPEEEHTDETEEAEERRESMEEAPRIIATTHSYRFLTERDFRGFVRQPEAMMVRVQESFVAVPAPAPAPPEERRVIDVAAPHSGFLTENDFRPASEPSVAPSPGKRTPSEGRRPASSPPGAPKGGDASGGRTSFASEFSGFGDSDSESSASDGYSVKELVVESDSDWFLSEKDFPTAAHDAGGLRSYKAKVLKAIEALEEAKLEHSFQDSATTVSPGSAGRASPDSIAGGSVKYPEDMWSRSPSPDAAYEEKDEKEAGEAEEAEERIIEEEEEEGSVDFSDDGGRSPGGKKMAAAPVYDVDSAAKNSLEHSEKETITIHDHSDHSDDAVSDVRRSPEAASQRESAASPCQDAVHDAKKSPEEPSESVGTNGHSFGLAPSDWMGFPSTNDQSDAVDSGYRSIQEHSEIEFACTHGQSQELISDVWEQIVSKHDLPDEVGSDDKRIPESPEKEFASKNDHSDELTPDGRKAIFSMDDQSYATVSDDKSIPEPCKISSEPTEEEHASANGHSSNAPKRVHFSVTEKAKALDEEAEDQEDKWKDLTEEEEDELESLWEHQDLIEQLKLELKKVRSIGLPTILEESETPKAPMEDLKPWRIDTKFLREDPMDELNKFYKSYRERMRKFDILCYQKMYAIDFLQLRGPQQSTGSLKTLSPTMTSILSHNFRSSRRRPEDPSERFLKELRYDLETVYVGQMCLSWEFLRWQYEQARDLPESDPYHSHQYNQVAGEFQQFQVVVQRFVEDESFKGPRLPNYINNRCVLRNILQVPVIKEDSLKDRMEDQRKGNYVITSEELEDIMAESMHTFWEFIKADKVETMSVLKGLSNTHVELQDPLDHDLMMHIHATLQKKEKKLKDLLRTGNCIVKKFKKPKEDRSNQILFFSQVDMRLVARVLRMPRITSDQLQWCKAKLDKIILVDRKIHREPSFLLFPC